MSTIRPLVGRLLAVLLLFLGACGAAQTTATDAPEIPAPEMPKLAEESPAQVDTTAAQALSSAFRAAAQHALPAVVFIQVQKEAEASPQVPEPFRFFFGTPPEGGQQPPPRGEGSGFLIDGKGHIITNNHVVSDADYVLVRLVDGREFEAEVVGGDENTDVAVIKIDPGEADLQVAELGDSESLQVGDWVLALGSPLELDFTVTAGIVSAKERQVSGRASALESFIQTDAAINPGNSGGPLVDLQGRVVGINTLIFGGPRFVGYGFAIPIDLAKRVVSDLLEYGVVRRPRLGVRISDVTATDAEAYGLDQVAGADINFVEEGSPAQEAGLQVGDVVVALDGRPIGTSAELTTSLAKLQPGDEVELTVVRDGKRQKIEVELGMFEQGETTAATQQEREGVEEALGFRVEPLTRQLASRLGYDEPGGVVISNVTPFSPAANAGIRAGQKLLAINRQRVETPADVAAIAREVSPGNVVSLRVVVPELGETIINYRARR